MPEKPQKPTVSAGEIFYIFVAIFFLATSIVLYSGDIFMKLVFLAGAVLSFVFFVSSRNKKVKEYHEEMEKYERSVKWYEEHKEEFEAGAAAQAKAEAAAKEGEKK